MQFDQDKLAANLFSMVRNEDAQAECNVSATFEQANIMCKFVMPPPSHQVRKMNSYSVPSWDVIRYVKTVDNQLDPYASTKTELRYVTLSEAPNMMYFCVRPDSSNYPNALLIGNSSSELCVPKRLLSKKPNFEITKIDMSINTSSSTLSYCDHVELDREEMDRQTLSSCSSLSGFPYDRLAFRKYRHFAMIKMEDLSGIFSTAGASDPLTIQGQVYCRNNIGGGVDVPAKKSELIFYGIYWNKKFTLTRVSAAVESVTVSKEVARGIRNGRM